MLLRPNKDARRLKAEVSDLNGANIIPKSLRSPLGELRRDPIMETRSRLVTGMSGAFLDDAVCEPLYQVCRPSVQDPQLTRLYSVTSLSHNIGRLCFAAEFIGISTPSSY